MAQDIVKVKNTDLVRDINSKAVLATDVAAYELYKKRRAREDRLLTLEKKLDLILKMQESGTDVQN